MTPNDTTPKRLRQLNWHIALQRLALTWENLWPRVQPFLFVTALLLAVILSGVLPQLFDKVRFVILGVFVLALLWSLNPLRQFFVPTRLSAMRRMEQASAIEHRALSTRGDSPSVERNSLEHQAIWEEHQRRQLLTLHDIKLAKPRSSWRTFDPKALRVPAFLLVVVSALLGEGTLTSNTRAAFRLSPAASPQVLTIDAWIKPPAYTGKPPVLLSSESMAAALASGRELTVPENSLFTARVNGATAPSLLVLDTAGVALPIDGVKSTETVLTAELKLTRPLTIVLSDNQKEVARYPIVIVPDDAPEITIPAPPSAEARGRVAFAWTVKDDYGVKSLKGEIELADEQAEGIGFASNGVFLYDAPELAFALRRPNSKEETGKTTQDLAAHPWAGLRVTLTLLARDGADQDSAPATVTFDLPERPFIRPMAQALIEQRKQLILFPEKARSIGAMIDALMLYPNGLLERTGHVLAAASLASRLRNATGYDDVKLVIAGLWDLAVAIDEGKLDDARAELQALKKELEKALQDGAPPERIAELMDKMRKALDKFMEAMREEAERRQKDGTAANQQPDKNGKSVSRQDLQKLLDALEGLAKGGAKEQAQQLLSELDRMLQNMQPGMGQQSDGQDGEMSEMLDQLGEMMQRQQGLMDETQRQPGQQGEDGQEGEGQKGQQGQGQQGQEGQSSKGMGGLAERQGALQGMLDDLMGGGQGQLPSELGDASRAMKGAEKSLRDGDKDGALQQQGEALEKLRKGAGRMAEQMQENGQGQAEGDARDGEGRGRDDDPLGRPRATRNPDTGPDKDMVPNEQAMRRAREILETLRAKSNEQGLGDSERSYIERLLRGLY